MNVRAELFRYELALARREPAGLDRELADLIADDFFEFGASGGTWDAESMRKMLRTSGRADVELDAFTAELLSDGIGLVTYRVPGVTPSNRSSAWVHRDRRWVIRFHQGTPAPHG